MANALLVTDQYSDQDSLFANPANSVQRNESSEPQAFTQLIRRPSHQSASDSFAPPVSGINFQRNEPRSHRFPVRSVSINPTRYRDHSSSALRALEQIEAMRKAQQANRQFRDETDWLAANGAKFAGCWVAILGRTLLAVGNSAKEVYDATIGNASTPLVVKIESDTLPFSGW